MTLFMCLFMLNKSELFYLCACVLLLCTDIYFPFKKANLHFSSFTRETTCKFEMVDAAKDKQRGVSCWLICASKTLLGPV